MIYKLIRPIVRFASKLYFRKIYIDGLENIPKNKPVILVSNHPSAFIEPCLFACFLPLNLHFLVRGDLFSKKWLSWLLKGTNQIPIFRYKDGLNNVKKNLITQEAVRELFEENKCLLMFPEAHTHENLFLRPLKKGLSRFAFMDHGADVEILPVGVNFDKNVRFNSKVSLIIGEPLNVNDFKKGDFKNESRMHQSLLREIESRMKNCIRHIDNEEREGIIYRVFSFMDSLRTGHILPIKEFNGEVFQIEKEVAKEIDKIDSSFNRMNNFFEDFRHPEIQTPSFLDVTFMLLILPLFLLACIFHFIPILSAHIFVKRKITAHEFKSPVFLALMIFQYLFLIFIFIIMGLFVDVNLIAGFICVSIIGILSVLYYRAYSMKWKYLLSSKEDRQMHQKKGGEWKLNFIKN